MQLRTQAATHPMLSQNYGFQVRAVRPGLVRPGLPEPPALGLRAPGDGAGFCPRRRTGGQTHPKKMVVTGG